jgi:hypothetical protein
MFPYELDFGGVLSQDAEVSIEPGISGVVSVPTSTAGSARRLRVPRWCRWSGSIHLRYTYGPVIVSGRKDCSGRASKVRSEQLTEP